MNLITVPIEREVCSSRSWSMSSWRVIIHFSASLMIRPLGSTGASSPYSPTMLPA